MAKIKVLPKDKNRLVSLSDMFNGILEGQLRNLFAGLVAIGVFVALVIYILAPEYAKAVAGKRPVVEISRREAPVVGTPTATRDPGDPTTKQALMLAEDPARRTIRKIVAGDFGYAREVASGRFLRDFEKKSLLLQSVLVDDLQLVRRGRKALRASAPFWEKEKLPFRAVEPEPERRGLTKLRFVKRPGRWLIEDLVLQFEEDD